MADEKEYIVSLNQNVDYDQFWSEMENNTLGLDAVPDRIVDIVNERPGSLRSCHYALTDQEAMILRNDPRVYCVEIPPQQRTDIIIKTSAYQTSNFTKTTSDSGPYVNYALRRCISQVNPYITSGYQPSDSAPGDYTYNLDGSGVDVVIHDSGLQIDHPEFQDKDGNSRVRLIDWYAASGLPGTQSIYFYRDYDGHGTHVAGIATGKTYGWAKNAAVYSLKVNGLEGSGDSGTGISQTDCFDVVKMWHLNKPVDPRTGYKRPTVVNMSWGYLNTFNYITGGNYRGTSWTGTTKQPQYGMIGSNNQFGTRIDSVDVDIEEMIAAGIIICTAAGNNYQKIDVNSGIDYNYYFTSSLYGNLYYHRGGSPLSPNAINVGATGTNLYWVTLEMKDSYSDAGPGVDVFAPGGNIMSCTSNTNGLGTESQPYFLNTTYNQTNMSGTSMASPQVTGICALFLSLNPFATPAQVKAWMLNQALPTIYSTGLDNDYTDPTSIVGAAANFLYSPFNNPLPVNIRGDIQFLNTRVKLA